MHQHYVSFVPETFEHHQLIFAAASFNLSCMSRLNFMEEQELAIRAIAHELVQLERMILRGELVTPENAVLLDSCIADALRIQDAISKQAANLPLQNWRQKTDRRSAASGKRPRSELVRRAS